jgi:protein-disulfide isomerase
MKLGNKLAVPVTEMDHAKGRPDAAIELVEYGDFECPYCRKAFGIVTRLLQTYGDNVHYVFRNFPLQNMHPHALSAAKAVEAAALQRRYWQMHELLFENQDELDDENLMSLADEIGLNVNQFERAFKSSTVMKRIESDVEGARQSGVESTPAFFINGRKYEGDWSYDSLSEILNSLVRGRSLDETFKAA